MAALPVVSGVTPMSGGQNLAEGLVAAINSQAQTLLDLKTSSLGILKATLSMKDTLESNAASANLDSGTVSGNVEKKKGDDLNGKFGAMLDSMQDAFDGLGGGTKSMLGIAALLGGLALMNEYADELAEFLAPVLKFFNEKLIPTLKELNQIILDQPGGYLTLLGAAGLTKTMFDIFSKGGKIAKVIDDTTDGLKVLKQADLLDDLAVRKVTWATRLRTAFTGRLTGLFTKLGSVFTSIGTSLRALGAPLLDDLAVGLKQLTPTWLKVLKLQLLGGSTIYPIVAGGGKQIGLVGKVSQGIQAIVTSIKGLTPFATLAETLKTLTPTWLRVLKLQMLGGSTIYPITKGGGKQVGLVGKVSQGIQSLVTSIKTLNPFAGLGATLKTLGSSWKLAISAALFGKAAGAAGVGGSAGVLGSVTNAITRIAVIIKGIFSPASILGKFTKAIGKVFKIIGTALGFVSRMSGLTSFLRLGLSLGKAIPVVGQIIMVLSGIFGFISGAIKGFKTGGILGAIKGGLIGLYDATLGSILNLFADVIGFVFKKLGFEKVGEFFSNMDFSFASIMNGLAWAWDKIQYAIWAISDGIKAVANGVMKGASWVTLGLYQPDYIERPPFVSTYTPMAEPAAPELPAAIAQPAAPNVTRVSTSGDLNLQDLAINATADMKNQDIAVAAVFDDIDQNTGISDAEAQAMVAEMKKEPSAAEIAANEAELSALVVAEMKRLELEADAEIAAGGGIVYNDTSSKSQMNNTQMVSTGLSVDASDLVAAKLNMMLPSFN